MGSGASANDVGKIYIRAKGRYWWIFFVESFSRPEVAFCLRSCATMGLWKMAPFHEQNDGRGKKAFP